MALDPRGPLDPPIPVHSPPTGAPGTPEPMSAQLERFARRVERNFKIRVLAAQRKRSAAWNDFVRAYLEAGGGQDDPKRFDFRHLEIFKMPTPKEDPTADADVAKTLAALPSLDT
jgi:hypothetical protein